VEVNFEILKEFHEMKRAKAKAERERAAEERRRKQAEERAAREAEEERRRKRKSCFLKPWLSQQRQRR